MVVSQAASGTLRQYSIRGSVGHRGVNSRDDILVVQKLLEHWNRNSNALNGAGTASGAKALASGEACPETVQAIKLFQRMILRLSPDKCDGRVDVGGRTWIALAGNRTDGLLPAPRRLEASLLNSASRGVGAEPKYFAQGDASRAKLQLGNAGNKETIQSHGCLLCALSMAASWFGFRTQAWVDAGFPDRLPKDLTPEEANTILRKGGAFTGAALATTKSAALLGMEAWDTGIGVRIGTEHVDRMQRFFSGQRRAVAAFVDYRDHLSKKQLDPVTKEALPRTVIPHAGGDHWVLYYKGAGGDIMCYDPGDPEGSLMSGRFSTDRSDYDKNRRENANPDAILFGAQASGNKRHFGVLRLLYLWPATEVPH